MSVRTLFRGGHLFDGESLGLADVVVEGDRIVDVGPGLDADSSVDCAGKTILPGLFDTHVHLVLSHINVWQILQTPFSYRYYEAMHNMAATVRAGITTVRDAGGADLGMKEAVENGLIVGPRMHIALSMLSQTGGHGDGWLPSGASADFLPSYPGMPSTIVDGAEEMRKKVRELVRAGADVIKVATSGGVLSPRDEPTHAHFSLEELEMLVAEASAAGLWVMAHAQATDGIKNAIRAGIRSIDHGIYLDDEAIGMMLERGTFLVPTLVAPRGVTKAVEAGAQIPEASIRKAEEVVEAHRDSFRRAVQAGVKIAMGTDSGVTPHGDNLEELTLMVEGGMTPLAALTATTRTAAELMGMADQLGTVEAGKVADLVVVGGDPFEFDTLGRRVEQVWMAGSQVI
ncbi:MAG: amidohydrolase family protein [Acidimicrobiia bacterium]|nr:amidohydrolase family protein [Acidimicrobiia bacterium]